MSKKINLSNVSDVALSTLSKYNVAIKSLKNLRDEHMLEIDKLNKERDELIEKREKALADGMSIDEVTQLFPLSDIDAKIASENENYKNNCKPHKDALKACYAYVPSDLYEGYKKTLEYNGDMSTFTKSIQTFLHSIGVEETPEVATGKLAQYFSRINAGTRKANKSAEEEGHYTCAKSAKTFNDLFLRNFLEYAVVVKGVFDQNDDYSLVRHDFSKDSDK